MRVIAPFLVLLFFMSSSKVLSQDLDSYQWKNRVILLKDTDLNSDWLQAQLKRLKSNAQQLLEREVVLFLVNNKGVYDGMLTKTELQADSIITKYGLSDFEGLVLIGKDGTTKLKEEFIVHTSEIIELIDSMPMRKTEMSDTRKID
ncbi:DUF4174 domain-containing protein [Maribacter algarum]|uniref:DUF4174 domain-containing protein n=1 Tax=Maribacter algarum (ex Zhang et al. 2020) TaxID=2578118 RepID=A0A5S3PR22_9FLAO|nr:DUF4174 domain-containing protein [Maribacter algarum]TMM56115.1 DUF4174 domain-containing protein [Maribacter algarum]